MDTATRPKPPNLIRICNDSRWDLDLRRAVERQAILREAYNSASFRHVELKSEYEKWFKSGNLAFEYADHGRASGIATTQADMWVQECLRLDDLVINFTMPTRAAERLADRAIELGRTWRNAGDGTDIALVPMWWLFKGMP